MDADRTTRAFISYSHADQAFALALHDELEPLGIRVWIDKYGLLPGDTLVKKIGDAIAENDFVIGIVTLTSLKSEWCNKELALAATDGINKKKVKVIPVRLDSNAEMPHFLSDLVYVDADRSDPKQLAETLAFAMERHLEPMSAEIQRSLVAPDAPPIPKSSIGAWSGVPWKIQSGPRQVPSGGRDAKGFAWDIERDEDVRQVIVWISGSAEASSTGLPPEVVSAIRTHGWSVIERLLATDNPPAEVLAATDGIRLGV